MPLGLHNAHPWCRATMVCRHAKPCSDPVANAPYILERIGTSICLSSNFASHDADEIGSCFFICKNSFLILGYVHWYCFRKLKVFYSNVRYTFCEGKTFIVLSSLWSKPSDYMGSPKAQNVSTELFMCMIHNIIPSL